MEKTPKHRASKQSHGWWIWGIPEEGSGKTSPDFESGDLALIFIVPGLDCVSIGLSLPSLMLSFHIWNMKKFNSLVDLHGPFISNILLSFSIALRGSIGAITKRRKNPNSEMEGCIKRLFQTIEQGLFTKNYSSEDQLEDLIGEQEVGDAIISFSLSEAGSQFSNRREIQSLSAVL